MNYPTTTTTQISNPIPRAKCGLNGSKPADSLKQHEKPVS